MASHGGSLSTSSRSRDPTFDLHRLSRSNLSRASHPEDPIISPLQRSVIPKVPGLVSTHYDNVLRPNFRRIQALEQMAKGKLIPETLQQQQAQKAWRLALSQTKEQMLRAAQPQTMDSPRASSSSHQSRSARSNQSSSPTSPRRTSSVTNRSDKTIPNSNGPTTKSKPSSNFRMDTQQPRWITHDRQVLRFFGYFHQAQLVRRVVICLYLVDHSISILEPKTTNSGILQGDFLRRAVIKKPNGQEFAPPDFCVGGSVCLHGTTFHLVDCDDATRKYYQEMHNLDMPAAQQYPDDSQWTRQQEIDAIKAKLARAHHAAQHNKKAQIQKFYENHHKVLRFYVSWHDPHPLYAEKRHFVLHFYLIDDTVEILETKHARRHGRGPFTALLKRCRVPKPKAGSSSTTLSPRSFENGGAVEYLSERDLRCGEEVEILSRRFLLEDCDAFTKEFYLEKHGITQESLQEITGQNLSESLLSTNQRAANADIHANQRELENKRIEARNFYRDNARDKKVLRFRARFVASGDQVAPVPASGALGVAGDDGAIASRTRVWRPARVDVEREFIISFFLEDDTLSVYEPPLRNSGVMAGNFLKRRKYKRFGSKCTCGVMSSSSGAPGGAVVAANLSIHLPKSQPGLDPSQICRCGDFEAQDFFVGALVRFAFSPDQTFEIIQADHQTLEYCESHPESFVFSDVERILTKTVQFVEQNQRELHRLRSECHALDTTGTRRLGMTRFRQILSQFAIDKLLNVQELITLVRRFQLEGEQREEDEDQVDYELFCDVIAARAKSNPTADEPLDALRRVETLRQLLSHLDPQASGLVSIDQVLEIMRCHRIDSDLKQRRIALQGFESSRQKGFVLYHELCDKVFAYGCASDLATSASPPQHSSSSLSSRPDNSKAPSHGDIQCQPETTTSRRQSRSVSQSSSPSSASCRDPEDPLAACASPRSVELDLNRQHNNASQASGYSTSRSQAPPAPVASTARSQDIQVNTARPSVGSTSSGSSAACRSASMSSCFGDSRDGSDAHAVQRFDPRVIELLQSEFGTRKYQLRKLLRDKDIDRSGFLNEDAFMQVVHCLSPALRDEDCYLIVDQLFPRNNDAVNYTALLEQAFR